MYAWFKKNSIFVALGFVVFCIIFTGWLGYSLARSKDEIRRIQAKFDELQRISNQAEETAKQGLDLDTTLIERTKKIESRVAREYKQVSNASQGLTQQLQAIITQSAVVEYAGLDSSGLECYRPTRRGDLAGDEIKE